MCLFVFVLGGYLLSPIFFSAIQDLTYSGHTVFMSRLKIICVNPAPSPLLVEMQCDLHSDTWSNLCLQFHKCSFPAFVLLVSQAHGSVCHRKVAS